MKPGWQSSEFWITLAGQLLALLALTGAVNVGDKEKLETALANAITAIFTILSSAAIVIGYIKSRSDLKSQTLRPGERSSIAPKALLPLLLIGGLLWAGPLQAAPPSGKSCLFIGRQPRSDPATLALLQQLAQNQQTLITLLAQRQQPAAQPMILVVPAPQAIPLGGQPRQDIPLGQQPRQDIPLGGQPKQDIPLGQQPRQDLPLGPAPRQEVPLGPAPRPAPPGTSKPLPSPGEIKPPPSGMTQYR